MVAVNKCFVDALDVLKISSKEAVENLDQFSEFKEYMHVKRSMQDELVEMIRKASESSKSELIMICGSVGDGKSHLLSYIKHHYPEMMKSFYLHNDASESFDPTKTSMDTLSEVLSAFSNEGLQSGTVKKVIVAINLGTLNNFIESKYKEEFSQLREFVYQYKIIDPEIKNYTYNEESSFHYINFTDYHMYTLTEKGPKSAYIEELLLKVLNEDETSYFKQAYEKTCALCTYQGVCPVQANYALLKKFEVRQGVITNLVKAMIKEKLIISTRDLLNFFNDLMTGGIESTALYKLNGSKLSSDKLYEQMRLLLINNLFEGEQRSHVLDKLALVDPMQWTNTEDEERMVNYHITNNPAEELQEDLMELNWAYSDYLISSLNTLVTEGIQTQVKFNKIKEMSYKLYKRGKDFKGMVEQDVMFSSYMKDLYAINRQYKSGIKEIVKDVKEVIYKWDGSVESQGVRITSSKKHKVLGIYEPIAIRPQVSGLVDSGKEDIEQFVTHITLTFTREGTSEEVTLDLDYALYELVKKLTKGYIVGEEEYKRNINLQLFIEKLLSQGEEEKKKLVFEHIVDGELKRYELKYDSDFDEYEFVGI